MTTALTVVLFAMLGLRARQWNPVLSYDTATFYYPALIERPQGSLSAALSAYLVHPLSKDDEPRADQAKPLFVFLLRLWHEGAALLTPRVLPFPNDRTYSDFITCSYVLAFLCCCVLGACARVPFLALAAAGMTFFSPWMICASYFNSYLAPSLVLFVLSVFLLVCPRPFPLAAGVLCGLNAQINQSTLAFVPAMVVLLASRPIRRRDFAAGALRFGAGFGAVVLMTDAAIRVTDALTGGDYLPQSVVLFSYLRRSFIDLREFFDVYRGLTGASLFPRMLWEHSAVLSGTAALLAAAALLGPRRGGIAVDRAAVSLALFLSAGLLVIDLRDGPKFNRSYVLVLPFLNLLVVAGVRRALTTDSGRRRHVLVALTAVVVAAYAIEAGAGLGRFDEAFLGVRRLLARRAAGETPVFVARADPYLPVFQGLVEDLQPEERRLEAFDDICRLLGARGDGVLVAVGPNVESVLVTSPAAALALPPASQSLRPPEGRCGEGGHWRAELAEMRPFFSHYPFLVWEDPYQTYSMLIQHAYTTRAYREPLGEVTVWRVKGDPATH